jgi:Arc/MetJ-type ribon-helix-helix transcriptional regulator
LVRKGYRNISIPEQLYEELESFLKNSKGRYVSIAEVIRVAVREFLDKQKAKKSERVSSE